MLSGEYKARAQRSYKTPEGKKFLAAVRWSLDALDKQMRLPQSAKRGANIASIVNFLEQETDAFDLYGEKKRETSKPTRRAG